MLRDEPRGDPQLCFYGPDCRSAVEFHVAEYLEYCKSLFHEP